MRRELPLLVLVLLVTAGCSLTNRLTFVRPNADRGEVTQVAPVYDVGDKGRKATPMAANGLVMSAVSQYQAGNFDEAARLAQRALKADPASADAHSVLAMVSDHRGKASEAGAHYLKATSLAPGAGTHANNYGIWLCGNGRANESLGWFDRALADPNYPTRAAALANAGTCAQRDGQSDRAEASWRLALAQEPAERQSLAGMAALQFARGRYLDARAFAERWLAVVPEDPDALQLASQIELKLGDTSASARYLHKLQALSPNAANAPRTQ